MKPRTIIVSGMAVGLFGLWVSSIGLILSIFGTSSGYWLFWVTLQLLSVCMCLTAWHLASLDSEHDD